MQPAISPCAGLLGTGGGRGTCTKDLVLWARLICKKKKKKPARWRLRTLLVPTSSINWFSWIKRKNKKQVYTCLKGTSSTVFICSLRWTCIVESQELNQRSRYSHRSSLIAQASIPGLRRFPGEGNSNPFQYPRLGSSMDRGAWWGYSPFGCKRVRHNLATK